jgi:hypothetical protein
MNTSLVLDDEGSQKKPLAFCAEAERRSVGRQASVSPAQIASRGLGV